jgi:murein DD-endopeptidase MepM/ murein hydrolase activator NlpD
MMTRPQTNLSPIWRALAVTTALVGLTACGDRAGGGLNLDWDLRSGTGALDTSGAAQTANRPASDSKGVLNYPNYQVAVAQRGDTVATVASRVGVGADELASFNALRPADPLRAGETLLLPRRVQGGTGAAATGAVIGGSGSGVQPVDVAGIATTALDRVGSSPAAPTPAAVAGPEPQRHKVARGETAFSIARTYGVSAKAIADWNGLPADLAVREGQFLIIPVATAGATAPIAQVKESAPGEGTLTPVPPSASEPLPDENVAPAAQTQKETPPSPELGAQRTPASSTSFVMPVDGSITRGYSKGKNDGIDIAASAGSSVKAAADGVVAAITKDTEQVPIVVIRHSGGLLTVYAGLDGIKVAKGAKVKRGQTIASVRAGNPSFVHFELRKGVDSIDPLTFLK